MINNKNATIVRRIMTVILAILVTLKLTGVLDIHWAIVLLPIWGTFVVVSIIILIKIMIIRNENKKRWK